MSERYITLRPGRVSLMEGEEVIAEYQLDPGEDYWRKGIWPVGQYRLPDILDGLHSACLHMLYLTRNEPEEESG